VAHQLTVVAPTKHLKRQWAEVQRVGISLDPACSCRRGRTSRDQTGVVVTYAGVASHPLLYRSRCENRRTLVVRAAVRRPPAQHPTSCRTGSALVRSWAVQHHRP
jgi:hypothetical protein